MADKLYIKVAPDDIPALSYPPPLAARKSRFSLFQSIACLVGVVILFTLGARCLYRILAKEQPAVAKHLALEYAYNNQANPDASMEFPDEHIEEFRVFVRTHNKTYSSIKEHWRRFVIFSRNLKEIRELQEQADAVVFGPSHFADMSEEELKRMLIPHSYAEPAKPKNLPRFDTSPGWERVERPASFDWRAKGAVMRIKNQGQCGSCWAFSVVAVVESLNIIGGGKRLELSEQELIDCDARQRGCFGGFRPYAFQFVKQTGLVPEDTYAYEGDQKTCRLPRDNNTRVHVDKVYGFDQNEDDMADWVATKGPITIGVNVTREMFSYRSGVFDPAPEDCAHKSLGSHALAVVGYGTLNGKDYWLLKNSWGPAWGGLSGYLMMRRGVNSCGLANNAYTALITKPH